MIYHDCELFSIIPVPYFKVVKMELNINSHAKGLTQFITECKRLGYTVTSISATVEKDNRVKFSCMIDRISRERIKLHYGKISVLPNGDIVVVYQEAAPVQDVEIRFNNVTILESIRYIIETIRNFNPKNRYRDLSIWRLVIQTATLDFDYVEDTKIQVYRTDPRSIKTHIYKGEATEKSFKPTDTINLKTLTDTAVRNMQFIPRP